jgi:hypothetical protein
MDIHKDFIKDGEIVYATKPDTMYFTAGKNRIRLDYRIFNAPNTKYINVYWNEYQDTLSMPVSLAPELVNGYFIIDGLEEKAYTFYVQTLDKDGNKSLTLNGFGTSYGNIYESTLNNRKIRSLSTDDTGGTINWLAGVSGLVRNEIRYADKNGEIRQVSLQASESSVYCPEASPRGEFEYRSVYIPERASIDTFYTAWVKAEERFPYRFADVDRSQWSIVFYDNSDEYEGSPNNIIDNNTDSYWHSDYHNPTRFPYTFIIDMKEPVWVGEIGAQSRQNNHYSKGMEFYTINDYTDPFNGDWIKLSNFDLPQSNDFYWKTCSDEVIDKGIKAHYLKVVLTSGYNGEHLGAIAEIAVKKVLTD